MSVGLAIIALNEEKSLPALLASVEGAFDQVVLVDTGSTDKTKQVFNRWARKEQKRRGCEFFDGHDGRRMPFYKVRDFKWVKDFAAARRFADEQLDTDWLVWADCDDTITNAGAIAQLAEHAPVEVAALVCGYNYAQTPDGVCLCYLKRERIVRRGKGTWEGRVHEAQTIDGPVQYVPPEVVEWVHRKGIVDAEGASESNRRNLEILETWNEDEPNVPRVLAYLGTENAMRGEHETALDYYLQYLAQPESWREERAQVCRKLASSLIALDRIEEAQQSGFESLRTMPEWPDGYLTLAEVNLARGEFDKAIYWADRALELGQPDTLLIINPLDYSAVPRRLKAAALGGLHRFDEAVRLGRESLTLIPDPQLARAVMDWQAEAKREHTAATYAMAAEQLIAHDEQLKALTLLEECVPYFARDHLRIVQLRSMLRRRLAWVDDPEAFAEHYATGGSKPEDFLPEEQIDAVCENLPRVRFALAGLREQAGVEPAAAEAA